MNIKTILHRNNWPALLRVAFMAAFLTVVATMYYGCQEAGRLECNSVDIPEANLPGLKGLKIALISDVHGNTDMLEQAVELLENETPDLIILAGDLVDATGRVKRVRNWVDILTRLGKNGRIPIYACLGNHDMEKLPQVERIFELSGVRLLRNEKTLFHSKRLNRDLVIAGLGDWLEADMAPERFLDVKTAEDSSATRPPVLLLSHYAISRHELDGYRWNLMLSGHTHGSQARNPFTGRALFHRDGESLSEGYLPWGSSGIYVTRGIGSVKGMRFFCPPEINIITIK